MEEVMNKIKNFMFKWIAKLIWFLTGEARDAARALEAYKQKEAEKPRPQGVPYTPEVTVSRRKIIDSEEDFQAWKKRKEE